MATTDPEAPKLVPSARQEIEEHLKVLQGEERKVRNKIGSLTRGLAISDQQLAGLIALQDDYRACLAVLPEDMTTARLTQDWLMLRTPPTEAATSENPSATTGL